MKREHAHVAALFAVAVLARILLFDYVGIWGDFGFYSYNSRLILQGQTPFVDFLGRSPLFIYSYAAVRAVSTDVVTSLRSFIVFWWLVAGVPVYLIARHIDDHTTGLAALAVYLLSPFALTYGFWANTQSLAAALAIAGVYALVKSDRPIAYLVSGGLIGAAFLSRRSVVVFIPAILLFVGWHWLQTDSRVATSVRRAAGLVSGFVAICGVGYLAVARGDVGVAWALAETHGINLFISVGRGGYPLLGVEVPPVTNEISSGRIPIFNDVCQMCGAWTARTFAKTLLVTVPVAGIFGVYLKDIVVEYFETRETQYMFGILAALGVYAAGIALISGYELRALAVVALGLFAIALHLSDRIPRDVLYSRAMVLVLLVLVGLSAGYLYRNRLLHTYYFMDFWPALSVVAGVLFVQTARRLDGRGRQVLAVSVVLGVVVSAGGAYPVTNIVLDGNDAQWFTTQNIDEYTADIDARTEPGDTVFVANPTYLTGTDAEMVNQNARIHYLYATFSRYESDGPAGPLFEDINHGLASGDIKIVITSKLTRKMIRWNETTTRLFEANYCRVTDVDETYAKTDSALYRYQPDNCANRPTVS